MAITLKMFEKQKSKQTSKLEKIKASEIAQSVKCKSEGLLLEPQDSHKKQGHVCLSHSAWAGVQVEPQNALLSQYS